MRVTKSTLRRLLNDHQIQALKTGKATDTFKRLLEKNRERYEIRDIGHQIVEHSHQRKDRPKNFNEQAKEFLSLIDLISTAKLPGEDPRLKILKNSTSIPFWQLSDKLKEDFWPERMKQAVKTHSKEEIEELLNESLKNKAHLSAIAYASPPFRTLSLALEKSIALEEWDLANLLLKAGAEVEETSIKKAIEGGKEEFLSSWLEKDRVVEGNHVKLAMVNKNKALAEKLVEKVENLAKSDVVGTALDEEYSDLIPRLIEKGAKVKGEDESRALQLALKKQDMGLFKALLKKVPAINSHTKIKEQSLYQNVQKLEEPFKRKMLAILLKKIPNDDDHPGRKEAIELILKHDGDLQREDENGVSPLYLAVKNKDLFFIDFLLTEGVKLDHTIERRLDPVAHLLEELFDEKRVLSREEKEKTLEILTKFKSDSTIDRIIKELKEPGAPILDLKEKNKMGRTVFFEAVVKNEVNIARALLKAGFDIQTADAKKQTIFHAIYLNPNIVPTIKALLSTLSSEEKKGAAIKKLLAAKNGSNFTAIENFLRVNALKEKDFIAFRYLCKLHAKYLKEEEDKKTYRNYIEFSKKTHPRYGEILKEIAGNSGPEWSALVE